MIKKYLSFFFFLFIFSCTNIEFVLKDGSQTNPLKDKTILLMDKNLEKRFVKGLYSNFGNSEKYEYILKTTFIEKKILFVQPSIPLYRISFFKSLASGFGKFLTVIHSEGDLEELTPSLKYPWSKCIGRVRS